MKIHLSSSSAVGVDQQQTLEWATQAGASEVRAYTDLGHAVAESIFGLLGNFPVRRNVAIWRHSSPIVDEVKAAFLKEGWLWQEFVETSAGPSFEKWAQTIKADSLFVLGAEDDPVTGRLWDWGFASDRLAEKKIFQIRVSHNRFLRDLAKTQLNPYQIIICLLPSGAAVGFFGSRARVPSLHLGYERGRSDLLEPVYAEFLTAMSAGLSEDEKRVREFEASIPGGLKPLFDQTVPRLWDRAVLCFEEGDSSAILDALAEKRGLLPADPGKDPRWESLSLCRWSRHEGLTWLEKQGHTRAQLRGVLILDQTLLEPKMSQDLKEARDRVLRLQGSPQK